MPESPDNNAPFLTARDLYQFKQITDAQLSPDGRAVIYSVQETDAETEQKQSNLFLYRTGSGMTRPFTHGKKSNSSPRWSPDGEQIAFISNRDDEKQPQIYLIPVDGGEARRLTTLEGQIGSLQWAPDGSFLLLNFLKKDEEQREREKDEQKKKLGVVARHITTTDFKFDGLGYLPAEKWHIWRVDTQSGEAKQLTSGNYHETNPDLSPDGSTVAFVSNRTETPDLTPDREEIYLMAADGGKMTRLDAPVGPKMDLVFSPDGRWLAYIGSEGEGLWYQNMDIWLVPVNGSQPARNLTASFDLTAVNLTSGDMGADGMRPPVWAADGSELYFQASIKGDTALMAVTVDEEPALRRVIDRPGTICHFSWDDRQDKLAYIFSDFFEPTELYLLDIGSGAKQAIGKQNQSWLKRSMMGKIEEVWFPARDGYELHGWVLFPPDFDPEQTYPSILEIHGGPMVQYGRAFMHEFHFLASHGYVVYFSNPRGGQGYGEAHCQAIYNNWGSVDFDDVMDWAAYLRDQPYIDPGRMGVTGGSYGGYMTNMIIGRAPDFFQAAVTQRSVSNLVSMWGSSDANWQFQQSIGNNMPPYANLENYWQRSPMKYISAAKIPTLVIHSERDYRVAQEQGEQVFIALRQKGVPTELVLFPDEPHGLSRTGRTDRRIARLEHILRWFDTYIPKPAN